MEHGKKKRKFGRETKQRKELMRDLELALITNGKIVTTEAKAKSLKPSVEKIISRTLKNDLVSKRFITARYGKVAAKKIITDIAPKFSNRNGGFTRIIKIPKRISDGSKMAIIEFVE